MEGFFESGNELRNSIKSDNFLISYDTVRFPRRTASWSCYWAIFRTYESNEAWRLQSALYDAVSLGKQLPTFRKIVVLSSGGSSSLLGLFNPEVEDSTILRNVGES